MSAIFLIPLAFWVVIGVWLAFGRGASTLDDETTHIGYGMVMHYCTACARWFRSFGSPCCPHCGRQSEL